MMTIEEFVRVALVDIARGIHGANEEVRELGVEYAPRCCYLDMRDRPQAFDSEMEFDIAVASTEGKTTGGKAKFGIGVLAASMDGDVETQHAGQHSAVSRVKFKIKAYFNPEESGDDPAKSA